MNHRERRRRLGRFTVLLAVASLAIPGCSGFGQRGYTQTPDRQWRRTAPGRAGPIMLATLVSLLSAACVQSTSNPVSSAESEPTTTSEGESLGGQMTIDIDGRTRSYLLFIPPGHNVDEPAPLVVNSHGVPSNPTAQVRLSRFDDLAAEEGIVVVYPAAVDEVWDFEDGEEMDRADVNDIDFIEALIEEVSEMVAIDTNRIYAIGFSAGGGISNLFACHMPDRIAAIVQVAGFFHLDGPACPIPRPIPVLAIIGESDPITTQGTKDLPVADQPLPADVEAETWATTNSCAPTPQVTQVSEAVILSQYACEAAAVAIYRHPGGHTWPSQLGPDTATDPCLGSEAVSGSEPVLGPFIV